MPDDDAALVRTSTDGGITTITLDSPRNRNALSRRLLAGLDAALASALDDDSVRAVVLDHTGPVFCSGADLAEARDGVGDDQPGGGAGRRAAESPVVGLPDVLERLWHARTPVVAVLRGPVRAGGIGLVAACHLALAAESTTLAFTEVRLGLVPAVISVVCLPRLRDRDAAELFLLGEVVDAHRAREVGLLTRVVADDDVDAERDRVLAALRRAAPGALSATTDLLRRGPDDLRARLDAATALSAERFAGDEGQEGIRAFLEKRAPSWVDGG